MFARVTAGLALVGAIVLIFLVFFKGDSSTYSFTALMTDGGQIVKGNRVQVGSVTVGHVKTVDLTKNGLAALKLEFNNEAVRYHQGTQVTVRANSLVGSTNRYVVLTPGPSNRPLIPDGGVINPENTTSPVDFDTILDALDAPTRQGIRQLFRGFSQQYDGRATEARAALHYFAPALEGTTGVLKEFALDRTALNKLIVKGALASRIVQTKHDELVSLINRANVTTRALANQSANLGRSLQLLPVTFKHAQTTFTGLDATLGDLRPLVDASLPATRNLAGFFDRLQPLLRESVPLVDNLSRAVTETGPQNDLTDLVRRLPSLRNTIVGSYPRSIAAMNRSQKELDALLAYTPDIFGTVSVLDQASSFYDANGHYVRAQPDLNAFGYDSATNQIVPHTDNTQRLDGFQLGKGARCPGGAIAATADGSAPRKFGSCDTSTTPPGP